MRENHDVNMPREFQHKQTSNREYNKENFLATYESTSNEDTWKQMFILEFSTAVIKHMLRLCLILQKLKTTVCF